MKPAMHSEAAGFLLVFLPLPGGLLHLIRSLTQLLTRDITPQVSVPQILSLRLHQTMVHQRTTREERSRSNDPQDKPTPAHAA